MLVPLFLRDASEAAALREYVDAGARRAGVGALPAVLFHVARDQATTSAWAEAEANYSESVRLAEETGQVTEQVMSLAGLCWLESRQGQRRALPARTPHDGPRRSCAATHLHMAEAWVRYALGDLELSLGEPARAVEQFRELEAVLQRARAGRRRPGAAAGAGRGVAAAG